MTGQSVSIDKSPGRKFKRFDIYVIDTGWNEQMSGVLNEHLHLLETYFAESENLYVLDVEQSTTILKANPDYIGKDPVLIVYDSDAMIEKRKSGFGFRYCLGAMKTVAEADATLKRLLQIALDGKKSANLAKTVRKDVHKEGLDGAMQILGESLEVMRGE